MIVVSTHHSASEPSPPLALATGELRLDTSETETHGAEWEALAADAGSIFGTREWLSMWWRHYGSDRRLLATTCRSPDGNLVAILPLYVWMRRPVRIARFLGHGPGDALGPICRPEGRPAVASALLRLLEDQGSALLVGERLPADEGWSSLLGAKVLRREPSPVLALEGTTWDAFFASRSKNFRNSIRSKDKRLAADHQVRYRLAVDAESFDRDFDLFLSLHRARWPEGSSFIDDEPFQREFATVAFARGWCRLWFLELDGEARAAWYGFRFANVDSYYQAGRDPRWDSYSLGLLLHVHTIREAAADGVREYRFLRGGEEFKSRFASHDHELETIALGRTFAGRTAVRASARLPRPILRRLA